MLRELDDNNTECVIPGKVCMAEPDLEYLKKFLKYKEEDIPKNSLEIINKIKKILGVNSESAIWESEEFRQFIGDYSALEILSLRYKPIGPAYSTALLSDRDIDSVLHQWCIHSQKLFGKRFYHVPFQMIDFDEFNTVFARLDLCQLRKSYDCFGCILNTDISSGPGKHWFCIFGDFYPNFLQGKEGTIEYFNSSGRRPYNQIIVWRERKKLESLRCGLRMRDIDANFRRLQFSNTECGVWCLAYIRSRLEGKSPRWLWDKKINDEDIKEYRSYLFRSRD